MIKNERKKELINKRIHKISNNNHNHKTEVAALFSDGSLIGQ